MGLLTDIYNTVAKFFRQQDSQVGEDASKSVAQNRLKLVLMQDRTNLTPKVLEQMRGEMIDLLSKYLEMDKELLELNFEQEGDQVALMLSIPVIRAKDEEEIEEAIKASKKSSEEGESDTEEDAEDENNEEASEEQVEDSVNEEKPKRKRRSKKVSVPEELEVVSEEEQVSESQNEPEQNVSENEYENVEA